MSQAAPKDVRPDVEAGGSTQIRKEHRRTRARIREKLMVLVGDARFRVENNTWPADETPRVSITVLVQIHLSPRQTAATTAYRRRADSQLGGERFTWGRKGLIQPRGPATILQAMRAADGEISALMGLFAVA